MRRTFLLVPLVALLSVLLVGCMSGPDLDETEPEVGVTEIRLDRSRFWPPVVQVEPGTTITWLWTDGHVKHDVVGDDFDSGIQGKDFVFEVTFDEPGTYDYTCSLHHGMDGRIIVKE